MSMTCVIGIGSPYGDDQLGWKVIEVMGKNACSNQSVNFIRCETPTTDLLSHLKQAEFAILVDAIHADLPIGQVCSWSQLSLLPATSVSSHGISLMTLLQLAENLGQSPNRWIVCGIVVEPESLALHATLSPTVSKSMPQLLNYIQQCLDEFNSESIGQNT
ncbi:hydrogenase maturation protease [Candidatus Albibeggiatoa sp. nov. BB20]|uniref:hydrogenase maturation protease n=1 Tax=Candidatus Albibeggiatoa sp. nov. BB20 TaxID=3162723 RepID=UPI0033653AD0